MNLAKSVCGYLTEHMDSHVTLDTLCGLFHASGTSVLEVAGTFGYNNGSKFAKAFRDVCGVSPNEYRQSADK